jgi:quercetin 2,3-dioxygenase
MVNHRAGFSSVDFFAHQLPIEPFLVFTEFDMDRPIFGPHPHAGVSVLTYMLPSSRGGFRNRDSFGDDSQILPGGAHVSQAGRGLMHDETPIENGILCHGMQIWVNHSAANRLVEPKALHALPAEVPEVKVEGGTVRVILGNYEAVPSPISPVTRVNLFHVSLDALATVSFDLDEMAFLYCLSGSGRVETENFGSRELAILESSGELSVVGNEGGVEFLIASGRPHREPIVYGGPYVATTEEELEEMKWRFSRGEMGRLSSLKS